MRIRPTTWAMLWYPLVCAALVAGFGAWLWSQCGQARRPEACRSDIAPGMTMFFLAILAIGMVVLAIVWFVGRVIARRSSLVSGRPRGSAGAFDDPTDAPDESGSMIDSDADPARRG